MTRPAGSFAIAVFGIALMLTPAFGVAGSHESGEKGIPAPSDKDGWCDDTRQRDAEKVGYCEVRETRMAAARKLAVDGGMNAGIAVKGSSQKDVLVLTKVQAWARTEEDARELADQVEIIARDGLVRAKGPEPKGNNSWWSASFRVYTPNATDLDLRAHNGGIAIEGVQGDIDFETVNGGVVLRHLAGDVHGHTNNGSLSVGLDGSRWQGAGLDVDTNNGAIRVVFPAGYNAELETGTTNGSVNIGFPGGYSSRNRGHFRGKIGKGGPPIRVVTTNGPVNISTDPGD